MTDVPWCMQGTFLGNCRCHDGCPCETMLEPTSGHCDGVMAMQIDEGSYGDVRLDDVTVRPVAFTVEVVLERIPSPMRIEVEMPGVTCPGCGRALVDLDDRDLTAALSDALIDAFDANGIRPG